MHLSASRLMTDGLPGRVPFANGGGLFLLYASVRQPFDDGRSSRPSAVC